MYVKALINNEKLPDIPPYYENNIKKMYDMLHKYNEHKDILELIRKIYFNAYHSTVRLGEINQITNKYKSEFETLYSEISSNKEEISMLEKYKTIQYNRDTIKKACDKIFICGSAGYPCAGSGLVPYRQMKDFYHGRILHFR